MAVDHATKGSPPKRTASRSYQRFTLAIFAAVLATLAALAALSGLLLLLAGLLLAAALLLLAGFLLAAAALLAALVRVLIGHLLISRDATHRQ
jgi:uncharacterized membrane protein